MLISRKNNSKFQKHKSSIEQEIFTIILYNETLQETVLEIENQNFSKYVGQNEK